jgi:membrane protease YdiL (CAAX protease family)
MNNANENTCIPGIQPTPSRKEQVYEILVFCGLILPGMLFSFAAGSAVEMSFSMTAVATMLNDIALVALISFLLWHNQESLRSVGWITRGFFNEATLGVILFLPMTFSMGLLEQLFESMGLTVPKHHLPAFLSPSGTAQMILAVVLVVVVAIAEETIFRGYFILRFSNVFKNQSAAVFLSAFIFSVGHGYEGAAGVATIYVMGIIFAVVYLWRKSIVAPMVMHFLQDFSGIILLPLLAGK